MGGGLPAAAFGGRADLMDQLAPIGPVYQAGTLSGNPVAVAAGLTTLRHCTDEVYAHCDEVAAVLRGAASAALFAAGVPHRVQQAGSMFSIFFVPDERQVRDYDDARTPGRRAATPPSSTPCSPAGCTCRRRRSRRGSSTPRSSGEALDRVLEALPARPRAARPRPRSAARERADDVVHLLRHGEVYNPGKILYGRLPGFRLSDAGVAMAEKAAEWFAGRDVTHLVSSPLERAQQTAAPIAEALSLPVQIDDRLIEAGNAFEGLRVGVGDGALRDAAALVEAAQPVPAVVGRALRRDRRPDARRRRGGPRRRPRARGRPGQPPAADLDAAAAPRGPPATCTTRGGAQCGAGQRHVGDLRRRPDGSARYAEPAGATDPDAVPGRMRRLAPRACSGALAARRLLDRLRRGRRQQRRRVPLRRRHAGAAR